MMTMFFPSTVQVGLPHLRSSFIAKPASTRRISAISASHRSRYAISIARPLHCLRSDEWMPETLDQLDELCRRLRRYFARGLVKHQADEGAGRLGPGPVIQALLEPDLAWMPDVDGAQRLVAVGTKPRRVRLRTATLDRVDRFHLVLLVPDLHRAACVGHDQLHLTGLAVTFARDPHAAPVEAAKPLRLRHAGAFARQLLAAG